ncbi:MAG: ferrochelatase [Anaerolineales bacterium]
MNPSAHNQESNIQNPKSALLLLAYGGPDNLDDIEPYLQNIRGGRAVSPALVAEYKRRYALIGGQSPLLEISRRQATALRRALESRTGVVGPKRCSNSPGRALRTSWRCAWRRTIPP